LPKRFSQPAGQKGALVGAAVGTRVDGRDVGVGSGMMVVTFPAGVVSHTQFVSKVHEISFHLVSVPKHTDTQFSLPKLFGSPGTKYVKVEAQPSCQTKVFSFTMSLRPMYAQVPRSPGYNSIRYRLSSSLVTQGSVPPRPAQVAWHDA